MHETAEQYRKRLAGYIEGEDPFRIQRETPAKLARLIDGFSVEQLGRRPAPDKWSIVKFLLIWEKTNFRVAGATGR